MATITIEEEQLHKEIDVIVKATINKTVIDVVREAAKIADAYRGHLQVGDIILTTFGIARENGDVPKTKVHKKGKSVLTRVK